MHEYVNSFSNIPVSHVPAGSGNAFAKTQMSCAGELCKDEESIYLIIKNNRKRFNIVVTFKVYSEVSVVENRAANILVPIVVMGNHVRSRYQL